MSFSAFIGEAAKRHAHLDFHLLSHLWFLSDLIILSLVLAAIHTAQRASTRAGQWAATVLLRRPLAIGSLLLVGLSAYLWALPLIAYSSVGAYGMALDSYPMWKILDGWRLSYYAPFFGLGVLLFGSPALSCELCLPLFEFLQFAALAGLCLRDGLLGRVEGRTIRTRLRLTLSPRLTSRACELP
jgi:hypothetical protein